MRQARWMIGIGMLAAAISGLWAPQARGAQVRMHSGTVVAINEAANTITLEEFGPWNAKRGVAVVRHLTIAMTPTTEFTLALRAPTGRVGPRGFPGEFIEGPLAREYLLQGDHVTVECRHEGRRLTALRLVVTELGTP